MAEFNFNPIDHDLDSNESRLEFAIKNNPDPVIKGYPFPIDRKAPGGFFIPALDGAAIKADLIQLLLTEPGERVMMPLYGTGLRRLMFEQGDRILFNEAKSLILKSIDRWEPRIVVMNLSVQVVDFENDPRFEKFDIADNSIIVSLEYSLKENLGVVDSLVFRVNYNPNQV